jgi:hypothetical protein
MHLLMLTPPLQKTFVPQLQTLDETIDKVDAALPGVRGLESSDQKWTDLPEWPTDSYKDLMDLGMQVDSVDLPAKSSVWPATCWAHAITAKTAKLDKKLKMIDLQMKKMRLGSTTSK